MIYALVMMVALAQVPAGPLAEEPQKLLTPQLTPARAPSAMGAPDATGGPDATGVQDPAAAHVAPAWQGTIEAGFAEMRASAAQQKFDAARAVADGLLTPNAFLRWKRDFAARGGWREKCVSAVDPLLDRFGWNGLDENARAEVSYAKAVVDALAQARPAAVDSFEKARAGAHDRSLRHDAIYGLGVLALAEGEEARATLPEISGQAPTPAVPPQPTSPLPGLPPGSAPPEPPDPLQVARNAYMNARGHFVERLKSDWSDADTQANVELCLKRLRELDDIEKKREEQKKKEEQQKKDQEQKDQEKKNDQKQQDKEKDKQDQDKKSEADKNDKQDDPNSKDPKQDEKKDEKKPEDPKPQDPKEDESKKDEQKPAQPTEQKNVEMSREEMTQLLDRLAQLEQEAQKIQAQLKAARRGQVKKDW